MEYSVELEREEDGRWIAEVPEIPGVMLYGATREEVVRGVEELAIRVLADRPSKAAENETVRNYVQCKSIFPPGWDEARVRRVIDYYDNQSDEEAIAEAEAALETEGQTLVMVPTELMPTIRNLIAKHRQEDDGDTR